MAAIAHVSQVVGDLVLRVPNVTNESAFALEVIVTRERYRFDVLKSDLESVHTKEEITELSRDAESELECSGCGRRFGLRDALARASISSMLHEEKGRAGEEEEEK